MSKPLTMKENRLNFFIFVLWSLTMIALGVSIGTNLKANAQVASEHPLACKERFSKGCPYQHFDKTNGIEI